MMEERLRTLTEELVEVAELLERDIGTAAGVLTAGMLINEGLHELAKAIQGSREVANDRWDEVARAIKATKSGQS